jgi:Delta7-sterol 5-desaturase
MPGRFLNSHGALRASANQAGRTNQPNRQALFKYPYQFGYNKIPRLIAAPQPSMERKYMDLLNPLFEYWVQAPLVIALAISTLSNITIYLLTALILSLLIKHAVERKSIGSYIDNRNLKPNQIRQEFKNGLVACVVLAICSLFTRGLFNGIWPASLSALLLQIASFIIFYETYSYFVHRLLHTKLLTKFHSVHHSSVRVTPWSAYSVHPIEAAMIGLSAPLFMSLLPLSLGVALILHISGMMFTILLHSNYQYSSSASLLSNLFSYSNYHSRHHQLGNANYSFVHRFWDYVFKTN